MIKKLLSCDCAGACAGIAPLALRLALGAIFMWHGWDKVASQGLDNVAGFLGSIGFPFPLFFAFILGYGELIAGIMLVLGAFTHWAAKYCTIIAIVALLLVHAKNGFSINGGGYEYIILILAVSISLMVTGAGKYSLDAKVLKDWVCGCKDGSCNVH